MAKFPVGTFVRVKTKVMESEPYLPEWLGKKAMTCTPPTEEAEFDYPNHDWVWTPMDTKEAVWSKWLEEVE